MTTNPKFSDRPDHPDFWKLSRAVIDQDTKSDNGVPTDELLRERGIESIDSVAYMAHQRILRATSYNFPGPSGSPQNQVFLMALYVDAFCAGLGFARDEITELPKAARDVLAECLAEAHRSAENIETPTTTDFATDIAQRLHDLYGVKVYDR